MIIGVFYLQSYYSIMKSLNSLESLVKKAKENDYKFIALSDDQNLYGMVRFISLCLKNKIKPVIGISILLSLKEFGFNKKTNLLIYALNDLGISHLIKISNIIRNQKKEIHLSELNTYQEGLFFVLSNIDLEFSGLLIPSMMTKILIFFKKNLKYFFFGLSLQSSVLDLFAEQCFKIVSSLEIKIIPTHKTNYLSEKEEENYEFLLSLSNEKKIKDFSFHFLEKTEFQKTYQVYYDDPKYHNFFLNLESFLEKINYNGFFPHQLKLPFFKNSDNISSIEYLREITFQSFKNKKICDKLEVNYIKRLEKELKIIENTGYEDYFLIIADLVFYAKQKKILLGPGRGSSASSLVCFCLGITEIDSLKYNLFFERFLNLERQKMPDIDLDFPDDKIFLIHKYILEKYGSDHVANIITFNTLTSKSFLRNNDFSKNKNLPFFSKLDGVPQFTGTHPAGIIICNHNLFDFLPVQPNPQLNTPFIYQTQLELKQLAKIGLLKIDLLSLKSLTLINKILCQIQKKKFINWHDISLSDEATFKTLQKGDTDYIFQLESSNAKNILKKIKIKMFEDVVAILALIRPGAMNYIDSYCRNQKEQKKNFVDPSIDSILKKTYGIILYQEQVMEIVVHFAGYNLGEAEIFMKKISQNQKIDLSKNELQKEDFIRISMERKARTQILAQKVYQYIFKFSNYIFNKSHSVSYAMISYRMAYLKTNYSLSFFIVLLNEYRKIHTEIFLLLKNIKKKYKISFLKPNIFKSEVEYVDFEGQILLPLGVIPNFNDEIITFIIKERKKPIKDFYDLKLRLRTILNNNNNLLKALILVGALDDLGLSKKNLLGNASFEYLDHEQYLISYRKTPVLEDEFSPKELKQEFFRIFNSDDLYDILF